jgi:O-antigen biosynthesis protein
VNGSQTEAELLEALRLARRELKLARTRQEVAEERLQRVRRERAALRGQLALFSGTLATLLSERYWKSQRAGLMSRVRRAGEVSEAERDMVAAVEASDLFDGAWYLRQQPDVVRDQVSPALHYVRTAADTRVDPGPDFDTRAYIEEHPDARGSDLPALVHRLRRGDH